MQQLSLVPTQLVDEQPADRSLSKDLIWTGTDEQGRRYALKTIDDGDKDLPIIEWLCYHLCAWAGILTPDFTIVTRLDGSLAFGSRWEVDARQFSPGRVSDAQFTTWIASTRSDIAAMLALDAFMPNEDRHFGNLLFVDTGARLRALAFDWSKTRLFEPWPWSETCNTQKTFAFLMTANLLDKSSLRTKLERILTIDGMKVQDVINSAPEAWRDNPMTSTAALWWDSHKFDRLEQIKTMLKV